MHPHTVDLNSVSSLIFIGSSIVSAILLLNRHRIARHWKRVIASFRKTSQLVNENERLAGALSAAEERNLEWEARFENVDKLRIAFKEQLERDAKAQAEQLQRLEFEIADARRHLSSKDSLIDLLKGDRDALLTHTRLLVGQMHENNIVPAYQAPALRSLMALPGPDMPVQPKS